MNWSLRQVLAKRSTLRNYPLPDLEPGQTYDLIFNLNLKSKSQEVTHWSLCLLDAEGEEAFFGQLLKASLKGKEASVSIIDEYQIAAYTSGICPITSFD